MTRAAHLALLVATFGGVACGSGCSKRQDREQAAAQQLVARWRDEVCACKDYACVNALAAKYANLAPADPRKAPPIDTRVLDEAQRCLDKLAGADATTPPAGLPATPAKPDADALIAAARAWQQDRRMTISNIMVEYVDATGTLDPEYGRLSIAHGTLAKPLDDPNRRTGTPVKTVDTTPPPRCPTLTFQRAWTLDTNPCPDEEPYTPHCTVAEIWRRAIAEHAPADAVAIVTYRNTSPARWRFAIRDEPRDVNIVLDFRDDCERQLERTP